MTVAEVIARLGRMDPDLPVVVNVLGPRSTGTEGPWQDVTGVREGQDDEGDPENPHFKGVVIDIERLEDVL